MKIIFWDFNGTILDDRDLCFNILNQMLQKHQRPTVTMDQYLNIFTFPVIEYYQQVFDLSKTPFDELASEFMHHYQKRSLKLKLHEGVVKAILYAQAKGYKNVLLSASEISRLKEQIKHYEIEHLFDDVLGTRNIFGQSKLDVFVGYLKYNHINADEAIIIGDTTHDAELSSMVGCDVILYTQGHQHKDRLLKYKTIDHFQALIDII
ncbi:MAG: HAD family hydrolase [Acholeplasmataceae bacterium]